MDRHPDLKTVDRVIAIARGLALGWRGVAVVADVDLTVRAGEWWLLLGRNGSGKSTFLRALIASLAGSGPASGDARPLAGTVQVNRDLVWDGIGYVPQRLDLDERLTTTAREFVATGLAGSQTTRREREQAIDWSMTAVGLGGCADRDLRALSVGQRQRAAVARALARRSPLLVLDEPTSALDEDGERALLDLIADQVRREQVAVVMVTHDEGAARRHATHWCRFDRGRHASGAYPRVGDAAPPVAAERP
ncbi:MAG TPA: ATP-binding cassette domain-containing protein [Planctomycetota bacterium]|nr:ATP-binding cassette domain-containing protein [Planctomycetota bacterium]